jgi:hypothetical protein
MKSLRHVSLQYPYSAARYLPIYARFPGAFSAQWFDRVYRLASGLAHRALRDLGRRLDSWTLRAPDIDLAAVFDVTDLLLPVRERPFIPLVLFALASLVS